VWKYFDSNGYVVINLYNLNPKTTDRNIERFYKRIHFNQINLIKTNNELEVELCLENEKEIYKLLK